MNYASFINTFDLFVSCYVYGCLTYIAVLFSFHLYHSLLIDYHQSDYASRTRKADRSIESVEPDFYTQVKDLLNPTTETILDSAPISRSPSRCFASSHLLS